jgi:DNA-binding NarL/FixJ family response regulator
VKTTAKVEAFTKRESEILKLLCSGMSVSEIAEKLYLSPKTVETHRSTLLRKTASKNTINLVLYAIKNKIVEM